MKTSKTGHARKAIQIVLAAGMAIGASQQALADDIFLKIPGVPGESQDKMHKDEIEIQSFSQWVDKTNCELSFSKRADKATPILQDLTSKQKRLPSATLVVRRVSQKDESLVEYMKLTMSNFMVVSSSISVAEDGAWENFTINPAAILIGLRPQLPDGKQGPEVSRTIMCGTGGRQ